MKAKAVSNLVIGVGGVAGLLLSTGTIAASYTNTSGTICKGSGDETWAGVIRYTSQGLSNIDALRNLNILCPLSRDTTSTNGATAYVDVKHSATATTTCTFYSYSRNRTLLGSFSRTWTGIGFHEFVLTLSGKSDYWSDYTVTCTIPTNQRGLVMGVDLLEP